MFLLNHANFFTIILNIWNCLIWLTSSKTTCKQTKAWMKFSTINQLFHDITRFRFIVSFSLVVSEWVKLMAWLKKHTTTILTSQLNFIIYWFTLYYMFLNRNYTIYLYIYNLYADRYLRQFAIFGICLRYALDRDLRVKYRFNDNFYFEHNIIKIHPAKQNWPSLTIRRIFTTQFCHIKCHDFTKTTNIFILYDYVTKKREVKLLKSIFYFYIVH